MRMTPRYFFHGHAAALGGRIYRPEVFDVEVDGASALTVSGGISRADIKGRRYGESDTFISFARASTLAAGRFADEREALALTNHEMLECELSTISTARAEINDIKVGVQPFPVLKVGRLSGVLHATSPDASDEPCIELGKDSDVTGVFIDTFGLEVILNRDLYQTCDTRSKLVSASSDPSFVDQQGVSLRAAERADAATLTSTAGASADRRCPERPPSKDLLYATIVRELRWIGQEPPRSFARIDGHTVVVEDFGTIYFGEIVIRAASRHLTMLRLELGSPLGGGVSASSVGQSEGWVP